MIKSLLTTLGSLSLATILLSATSCAQEPSTHTIMNNNDMPQDTADELASHNYPEDVSQLTDAEWRARLTDEEYRVLRQNGTQRAGVGELTDHEGVGIYRCAACGVELFRSTTKFHSGCGWPSFYDPADNDNVELIEDRSHGMVRTEVRCANCDSHLGHVFSGEGYNTPTDKRFCINSVCLDFEPANQQSQENQAEPENQADSQNEDSAE